MAYNTDDHRELPDDYGTYPFAPPYPPRPPHPPRPAHRPPPAHPPDVPAREERELTRLRTAYRWLRRTLTLTLLAYYTGFLCMAAYLPGVMDTELLGNLNLGVCLGLSLVPLTLLAIIGYELVARSAVDPAAHRVRIADAEQREREGR